MGGVNDGIGHMTISPKYAISTITGAVVGVLLVTRLYPQTRTRYSWYEGFIFVGVMWLLRLLTPPRN